jgi:hypothetical protein
VFGVELTVLERLNRIAADVLPGKIRTETMGENYYSFVMTYADGTTTELPHIWIDPATSDEEIRDKLETAIGESFYPENAPDDQSVPNIQMEKAGSWHDA